MSDYPQAGGPAAASSTRMENVMVPLDPIQGASYGGTYSMLNGACMKLEIPVCEIPEYREASANQRGH